MQCRKNREETGGLCYAVVVIYSYALESEERSPNPGFAVIP